MQQPAENPTEFGHRDGPVETRRLLMLLLLIAAAAILNLTVGNHLQQDRQQGLQAQARNGNWAMAAFSDPTASLPIPNKPEGLKRIAAISNSHGATGGRVASHMQRLLDRAAPGRFEVLDLASPGIFAPDFLQRMARALDFDLDSVVVASAYISFSDRMRLARQAPSALSFFNAGVAERLKTGFWLRNYDLGLYLNTLAARYLPLLRFRPDLYAHWKEAATDLLQQLTGSRNALFLNIDIQQRWRFPDGFDRNLFQWRLYSSGRDGHLGDMRELVNLATEQQLPLLAINLPIDWDKSVYPHDPADYATFRQQMAEVYANADHYLDYQDRFPVTFSSYDALHPSWIGARLHALTTLLQLQAMGQLGETEPTQLLSAFLASGREQAEQYRQTINAPITALTPAQQHAFRRFDLTDADNARLLLARTLSSPPGSPESNRLLNSLALRLRYWAETPFQPPDAWRKTPLADAWQQSLSDARQRMQWFAQRLAQLQSARLADFPLPQINTATLSGHQTQSIQLPAEKGADSSRTLNLNIEIHQFASGEQVRRLQTETGRPISIMVIEPSTKTSYMRVDILGDGSFLGLERSTYTVPLPPWLVSDQPFAKFGS